MHQCRIQSFFGRTVFKLTIPPPLSFPSLFFLPTPPSTKILDQEGPRLAKTHLPVLQLLNLKKNIPVQPRSGLKFSPDAVCTDDKTGTKHRISDDTPDAVSTTAQTIKPAHKMDRILYKNKKILCDSRCTFKN